MADFYINGYGLKLTCFACPEQYDVFAPDGKQVAYLRLRHGNFTAESPDCGGTLVYQATPVGDGIFEDYERSMYLKDAILAIEAFLIESFFEKKSQPEA